MSENNSKEKEYLKNWLIAVVLLFGVFSFLILYVFIFPNLEFLDLRRFFDIQCLTTQQRIDSGIKALTANGAIFGGIAVLINSYYASRTAIAANKTAEAANTNAKAAQDKQITERFAKAVEQLGSEKVEVRLGAIYSFEKLAKNSLEDGWTIMEILTAFVRENAPLKKEENTEKVIPLINELAEKIKLSIDQYIGALQEIKKEQPPKPRIDIQAALTVIGRLNYDKKPENQWINLSKTDLQGAIFSGGNLQNAYFSRAKLQKTIFSGTNLKNAQFVKAELQNALLIEKTNLQNADFSQAHLQGVSFSKANLEDAKFHQADLRDTELSQAKNLNQQQIQSAIGDERTRLPHGMKPPKHWLQSE